MATLGYPRQIYVEDTFLGAPVKVQVTLYEDGYISVPSGYSRLRAVPVIISDDSAFTSAVELKEAAKLGKVPAVRTTSLAYAREYQTGPKPPPEGPVMVHFCVVRDKDIVRLGRSGVYDDEWINIEWGPSDMGVFARKYTRRTK